MAKTKFSLFVIESLDRDDENAGRYEGKILQDILKLSGIEIDYLYIRSQEELAWALGEFKKSKKRYLHFSCHGNNAQIWLTLGAMNFDEFAAEVKPFVRDRRVTFSACKVGCDALAKHLIPETGCYSMIGPARTIDFGDSALMWACFFHLTFRDDDAKGLNREQIGKLLRSTHAMFGEKFHYFRPSATNKQGYIKVNWNKIERSGHHTDSR
jgi:hypothetical protein